MRQEIPMLDQTLTKEDFLALIVNGFQSVIFVTVDAKGNPVTNVADIELLRDGKLIFATSWQKGFY